MQFTEILFAIFMLTVFVLYWLLLRSRVKTQNMLLLAASYFFYGWWDWRFLGLIILTTTTTYLTGLFAARRYGRLLTALNIVFNIGILLIFKYLNFFSENLQRLLSVFGWNLDWFTIDVLLPVGISFYTFQAIAYSVDVYKGRAAVCTNPVTFATFIAYFPQLVAGPIERASQLLPQIAHARQWNRAMASSGLRLILFGLMKKLCVADMLALYSDRIYAQIPGNPILVLLGGIVFSIEIYCDFSAYSEIARGVSRLLGIELMANFRFPYFSRNILEFWQRWHISLMLWFRDYLYIPLGGNRRGHTRAMWNTVLVFVVSGIWHGAAWNFIIWGIYWAAVYVAAKTLLHMRRPSGSTTARDLPSIILTFGTVAFGFYLFRCSEWSQLATGFSGIWVYLLVFGVLWLIATFICRKGWLRPTVAGLAVAAIIAIAFIGFRNWLYLLKIWWMLPAAVVMVTEWKCRAMDYPLERFGSSPWTRIAYYWLCIGCIIISEPVEMTFIYFQF